MLRVGGVGGGGSSAWKTGLGRVEEFIMAGNGEGANRGFCSLVAKGSKGCFHIASGKQF